MRGIRRRAETVLGLTDREDVRRELEFHVAERVRELVRGGLDEAEARAQAERELGSLDAVSAECVEIAAGARRARRRRGRIEAVLEDVRSGLRQLRGRPWTSGAVMLVVALSVAATVATLGLVLSTLFRPLALPAPDRVVAIHTIDGRIENRPLRGSAAPGDVADWRQLESFAAVSALNSAQATIYVGDEPERIGAVLAAQGIGTVLGVPMHLGRMFEDGDHVPGATPVMLLTYTWWRRALGADSAVIGRVLRFSAGTAEVVGVLPPLPRLAPQIEGDIWLPFDLAENLSRGGTWLRVIGRLRPGVAPGAAQVELGNVMTRLALAEPQTNALRSAWIEPLDASLTHTSRPVLAFIAIAIGFVVLIACANVTALLLAQAADRQAEITIRGALGAGPGRLTRQFLSESAACCATGALLGLALGPAVVRAFLRVYPGGLPRGDEVAIEGPAWLAGAVLAALLTVLGALPLYAHVRGAGGRPEVLSGARVTSSRRAERFRTVLVGTQIALCTLLLISGALLVRAYIALTHTPSGFEEAGLVAFNVTPPAVRYRTQADYLAFYDDLLERIRAQPGVRSAGYTSLLPYDRENFSEGLYVEGVEQTGANQEFILYQRVDPGYADVLGLPLVSGRRLTAEDREGTPRVGLVNETLARRLFGTSSPLGRRIGSGDRWIEIVGIVGDKRHRDLSAEPLLELFVPRRQEGLGRTLWIVVRTEDPGAVVLPHLRALLRRTDPTIAFAGATILAERVSLSIAPQRFRSILLGTLAALAVVLAVVGIWSLAAYRVGRQTRDIGIRMALGLAPSRARSRVLLHATTVATCGVVIGTAAAILVLRVVAARVFGVPDLDAATLVTVGLALIALTVAASFRPALRASRVDPLEAIRMQ